MPLSATDRHSRFVDDIRAPLLRVRKLAFLALTIRFQHQGAPPSIHAVVSCSLCHAHFLLLWILHALYTPQMVESVYKKALDHARHQLYDLTKKSQAIAKEAAKLRQTIVT